MQTVVNKRECLADYISRIEEAKATYIGQISELESNLSVEEKKEALASMSKTSARIWELTQELPFVRMECCNHILGAREINNQNGNISLQCFCPKCGIRNFYSDGDKYFNKVYEIFRLQQEEGCFQDSVISLDNIGFKEFQRIYKVVCSIMNSDDSTVLRPVILEFIKRKQDLKKGKSKMRILKSSVMTARVSYPKINSL